MSLTNEKIIEIAGKESPDLETYEHRGQLSLLVPQEHIVNVANILKNHKETDFDMLIDITAIDWLDKKKIRFEVVYFLYSNHYKSRLRLKVPVSEEEPSCPSVTGVWESANWYERETWDMYGISFKGHPNPRRFYMPEDFNDPESGEPLHPLRKDFPLMGIPGSLPLPPYPERDGEPE
jgi:NADH-quinone oxidoreductase subunit C